MAGLEGFESAFMDDYFAEADEHLVGVRRALLSLEATMGQAPPPGVLEELFRSFHSLKGISAMVELHDAETLAHHMESCLRGMREGTLTVNAEAFDTLLSGTALLEAVVGARRTGAAAPEIAPAAAALQALAASAAPRTDVPNTPAPASHAAAGTSRWRVTFVPSPELTARGVKVESIRSRLLQIGSIVGVVPRVLSGGGIAFEFDVQTEQEDGLAALAQDGVAWEPAASADAVPAEAPAEALAPSRPWEIAAGAPSNFVRVDLGRLDELMRLVGDLVITRARLEDRLARVERAIPAQDFRALQEHGAQLERQLRDLREGIMRVRLVPVGEIFRRMPFVVRDLARDSGKRVSLDLTGQSTEIDKFLIERMMDPVLHLVRNAISHGIESPDERIAAGKPPEGTIRLRASTSGETVVLDISDDGRGVDGEAVARRARGQGMRVPDGTLDGRALLDILCTSGFSTREEADRASGRGVGMAVVREAVQELGGALTLESEVGRGTTFTIALPLTLAITDAIIATVGRQTFAVPQSAVRELAEVDRAALRQIERNQLLVHRGHALPVVPLAQIFGMPGGEGPRLHVVVAGSGASAVGLLVDRITGQREIVVKSITDPLIRVDGVSGATELGDGRVVLILDVAALSRQLRGRGRAPEQVSA